MIIRTNHRPRPVVYGYELNRDERAEFDYIDWAAVERCETSPEFVRYRDELIDLHDLEQITPMMPAEFHAWSGYRSDSFFSGIVIRWGDDFEHVTVGTYIA